MGIDQDHIDETVLALLFLGRHYGTRFNWATMERLYAKGLISNPVGKAKSVVFTDEGLLLSERYFANSSQRSAKARGSGLMVSNGSPSIDLDGPIREATCKNFAAGTTRHLLDISGNCTGIDSLRLIVRCRERYPDVSFAVCDARDLSVFADGCFDLVFFSFNGIDGVDHVDRGRFLKIPLPPAFRAYRTGKFHLPLPRSEPRRMAQ
jgi:hypothetical protein